MKRTILISSLFVVLLSLAFYAFINLKDRTKENVLRAEPKFYIAADHLIHTFSIEKKTIDSIVAEDIIGVEGVIQEINTLNNKQTIFLSNSGGDSSVLCDMQNNQIDKINDLKLGDTIRIKGVFKGYLKDVILLNCVITNRNE